MDISQPESIFDAKVRLQLLQLQARRRMAERRAKGAGASPSVADDAEGHEGADEESTEAPTVTALPRQWKLGPPGIALHAWQQNCLRSGSGSRGTRHREGSQSGRFPLTAALRLPILAG